MATAVLRSHDALNNRMHLDAYTPSPAKPRRRRSPKPATAAASSPPARAAAPIASTPPPKPAAAQKATTPAKAPTTPAKAPAALGRRSPPARPAASSRKQPSPTKEKPKQRLVMEEVRILKRGEEPPAPAPAPVPAPVVAAPPVAQASAAAAVDQRAFCSTGRIGPQAPSVVPTKKMVSTPAASPANAAVYAGPAFSAAAPEPSSLPMPAFFLRRAESEATRGLRCLLRIGELA